MNPAYLRMRNLPSCSNLIEQPFAGRGLVRTPSGRNLSATVCPSVRSIARYTSPSAASQQIYDPVALRYNRPRQKPAFEEIRRGLDRPVAQSLCQAFITWVAPSSSNTYPRYESHMSGN